LNRKLRILHFIYDHPDNPWCGGGGARRTWEINSILASRHDITVFCGGFPGAVPQEEPFKVRFLGKSRNYIESRLKFMVKSHGLNVEKYDLVVEDFSAYSPTFPLVSDQPLVTILHLYHKMQALRNRGLFGLIAIASERVLLSRRQSVITVSEHLRPALNSDARVEVIGQGVNIPTGMPPSAEDYVLFLGRLDIRHKGLDILVQAWAQLPPELCAMPLYIAGGGAEAQIRALVQESGARNVHLIGRLNHTEALSTLNRAAFLCMPSRIEGSPLVIAEAFALGKPVIVSSIPALKALVPHGIAGLHVSPEDSYLLSKDIEKLLTDSALRRQLAKGARELGSKYSWEEVAKKQEAFYLECLEENRLRK
jgi:glycosyltransferase involved in cell wall biosynthesis